MLSLSVEPDVRAPTPDLKGDLFVNDVNGDHGPELPAIIRLDLANLLKIAGKIALLIIYRGELKY
jgi:hypothetical protein